MPCCNLDAYKRVDDHLLLQDNIIRYSGPGNRRQYCLGSIRHCTFLSQKIPDELFVSDHDKYPQLAQDYDRNCQCRSASSQYTNRLLSLQNGAAGHNHSLTNQFRLEAIKQPFLYLCNLPCNQGVFLRIRQFENTHDMLSTREKHKKTLC